MQPEIKTEYLQLWIESGILYGRFSQDLLMNLDIAQKCVQERIRFSNGVSYPCLFDMRGIKAVDKQAREYMAVEGARLVVAGALLIGSALSRTIGNIFLTINKPEIPTKLFTNETEAKEWLKQYL